MGGSLQERVVSRRGASVRLNPSERGKMLARKGLETGCLCEQSAKAATVEHAVLGSNSMV